MRLRVCMNASAGAEELLGELRREGAVIVPDGEVYDAVLVCLDGQEDMYTRLDDICRENTCPVVVAGYGGQVSYYEEIRCLEMGADDYIPVTTPVPVLLLRIQRLLRLYNGAFGGFHCWRGFLELCDRRDYEWQGKALGLTEKEYQLFHLLIGSREQMVATDELLEKIWKREDTINKDVLNTMIRKLRKKLHGIPFQIVNCYGKGYALKRDDSKCNI